MSHTAPTATASSTATLLRREGPWFALYFCLFLLIYGYSALRLGMHVDDVYDFCGEETGLYAAAGRWGVVLWRGIFGQGACVWAAGITAGLLLAVTILCQTHLLRLTGNIERLIYGGFYLGCIQFSHMLQFSFLCDAVAASFLAVTGAVYFMQKPGIGARLGSLALLGLAFGTYQATAFYFGALFLLCELRRVQMGKSGGFMRRSGRFILTGIGAAIIWVTVKQAAVHLPFVTQAQLHYAESYQRSLTCWPEFLSGTTEEKCSILQGVFMIGYSGQWLCLSALLPLIYLFRSIKRHLGRSTAVHALLLMLMLCITPYALGLLLLRQQTPWTFIAEPLMLAGFWGIFSASGESFTPTLRKLTLVILGFTLIKGLYAVSEQAKLQALQYDTCIAELRHMRNAADSAARHAGISPQDILLVGEPMHRTDIDTNSAEQSLTWSNMLYYYLRHLKQEDRMHIGTNAFYKQNKDLLDTLPIWPAPGSIQIIENKVIIKIGPQ